MWKRHLALSFASVLGLTEHLRRQLPISGRRQRPLFRSAYGAIMLYSVSR